MNKELATPASETTKRVALLVATVSSFLAPFMVSSTNVALPTIAKELRMDAILVTWVPMAYILPGVIFLLPFGKFADIYGRKKVVTYGVALFAVSSVLLAFVHTREMFILTRVFQGIGGAMIFGTSVTILTSVFPASDRGRVIGLATGAVYAGLSVGPFAGGLLTEQWGWRSIFFLSSALGLGVMILILWKLKGEWAEARGERFDIIGSSVYSSALIAVTYGFHLLPSVSGFLFLSLGIAGLILFLRWETSVRNPVLDWQLFRHNRVFALSNIAMFINFSATYAVGFLLSLYLQYIRHLSPRTAGLILVCQPVMQAAFAPYAGKLSDRIEPQAVASCGMGLTAVGLGLFALLSEGTPVWSVVAIQVLYGFGLALFGSPNMNAVMGSVENRFYGVASGIASTMRLTGNSFSISMTMLVFALCIGQVQITPEHYPAFLRSARMLFVIFASLCAGGIFASLSRGKVR